MKINFENLQAWERIKAVLLSEIDWEHIGYSESNNKKLRELYDIWATKYDEEMPQIGYNYKGYLKESFAKSGIQKDAKILDAGCGSGDRAASPGD